MKTQIGLFFIMAAAVVGVIAAPVPQGPLPTVTIAWDPPAPPQTPVWYNVYKTNSNPSNGGTINPCTSWTKVNSARIGFFMIELEYTDNNAWRGLSWYAVTAEDENGQSECSNIVAVNIPLAKPGRPLNPILKGITP